MMQYANLKHHSYNRAMLRKILENENFKVKIFDQKLIEKPIVVLAGNNRLSDRLALVYEFWTFPDLEINYSPLIVSARFIGRKFSVDIGAGSSLELLQEGGIPFPVLNFTYHP